MPAWVAAWLDDYGSESLTVALDVRETDGQWLPATRGWTQCGTHTIDAMVGLFAKAGLRHLLCNAIARDCAEVRRVGQEFDSMCRSRWSAHQINKIQRI